jgi:hypothetical protein
MSTINEIMVTRLNTKSPWFNLNLKKTVNPYKKINFDYTSIKNIKSDEYTIDTINNTIMTKQDIFVFYYINMFPVNEEAYTRHFLNFSRLFKEYEMTIIDSVNKSETEVLKEHENSIIYNYYNNKNELTNHSIWNNSMSLFFDNYSKQMTNVTRY